MIGKTVSHYKILEKLGSGGMGVVYKAQDLKLDRYVALKFLPQHFTSSDEDKQRFIHEAKAASALEHPNICTVFEIDETEDEQCFIAMSYCDGETLKKKIERKPLQIDKAIDIIIQVSQGLDQAHKKDIVHRDIKPANIMITENGTARIVDFGLAKLAKYTRLTREGTSVGTVAYMSPEQTKGEEVDQRTDIWALGAVFYEMIAGRQPFAGDYEQAVMYSIINEDAEPLTGLRTGVPMEIERIISKCLGKDPKERYQRLDDLLVDLRLLQKFMDSGKSASTVHTHQKSTLPTENASSFVKRLWRVITVVLIVLIAVLVYLQFQGDETKHPDDKKMIVVLPFENLGPAEDDYFAAGMTEEIISRLAAVSGLGVISRTSTVQYDKTGKSVKEIGKDFGVDYVLEGTVRWAKSSTGPSRVRITPQLIRVYDDTHLWANTYDDVVDDIFAVQSEIAGKVFEQLNVTLQEKEQRSAQSPPTRNLEAYQAYLRGRYFAGRPHFTWENWLRVIESYQQAVDLDSNFALAYAELASAHAVLYFFHHDLSDKRLEMAKHAANRAIELAPESPRVHLVLSDYFLRAFRNPEQALKELEIAEKGLQDNADVFRSKAYIFQIQGRMDEAKYAFERAFELSPRDADLPTELLFLFWITRQYPQAVEAADKAIALAPNEAWPYIGKALSYWSWTGNLSKARATLEAVPTEHRWLSWMWFWQLMFERKYSEALERLSSTNGEWISLKMWARPKSLLSAYAYELLNETKLARESYESARSMLENKVTEMPQDPRMHSSLGIVYATLDRKNEAIQEGKKAVELLPIAKDAFYGIPYVQDLAHIYTIIGDYDSAFEKIEYLLSIPSWLSVPWLEMDPRWNYLRGQPGFQELLKKYAVNTEAES
jgi:serine/threonine protein kinase/tetratricopeptide (TPR) repeat protein